MVFLSENKFYKTVKEICAFCVIFRIDLMYFVMDGDYFMLKKMTEKHIQVSSKITVMKIYGSVE